MNNDLISREALKKVIAEWKYHGFYDKLIEVIDHAPTVEFPEQITIKCDTEEDEQKLLSLIANAKVCRFVEPDMEIVAGKCPIEADGNCPLRPQGEWIEVTRRISDSETTTHWECSICKEHDRKDGKSKFCCECGAKMKGGAENDL